MDKEIIDRGIIDGLQTWEVIDVATGENAGWRQSVPEEN